MVKVTFNSALAQKEAKKDEPKSGEEALIIPPDTIAVDCKVRGPGLGGEGAGPAGRAGGAGAALRPRRRGTGSPRGPTSPFSQAAPLSCPAQLLCEKVRVQKAEPGAGAWGRPGARRPVGELCRVHGRWCSRGMCVGPGLGSVDLEPSDDMQNNKNNNRVWHFLPV